MMLALRIKYLFISGTVLDVVTYLLNELDANRTVSYWDRFMKSAVKVNTSLIAGLGEYDRRLHVISNTTWSSSAELFVHPYVRFVLVRLLLCL